MSKFKRESFLRKSIMLTLLVGAAFAFPAVGNAETVDMTSPENIGGMTIEDPPNQVEDSYVYHWDHATNTLTGGTISITSNARDVYIMPKLVVYSSDLPDMSAASVDKVIEALSGKILNKVEEDRYRVRANVEIVDNAGGKTTMLRSYELRFKYDNDYQETGDATVTGRNFTGGEFKTTLQNDGSPTSEYELNEEGLWYTPYGKYHIKPQFTQQADNVYAGIRSTDKAGGVTNVKGSSTDNSTLNITVDATPFANGKAYGVYANTAGALSVRAGMGTFAIQGKEATGIYAGNTLTDKKSTVALDGDLTLNITGDKAVGIEAGANGEIKNAVKSRKKIKVKVDNGKALYAHDGGTISLDWVEDLQGNTAEMIVAEKGGVITIEKLKGFTGNIRTDDQTASKIAVAIQGHHKGDLIGNVDARFLGETEWQGNYDGTGKLVIDGAHWTGDMKRDNADVQLTNGGLWDFGEGGSADIKLANFTGSDSVTSRGYVNVAQGNIAIEKYTGNGTFIYQHDKQDPTNIIGGKLTLTGAETVKLISEGMGSEGATLVSEIPSTIVLATPIEGIDTTNKATVEKVLNNLAAKLQYVNYAKGERNLTGKVEIQEGLTSSAATKFFSDIVFDEKDGQAKVGKIIAPYTSMITGYPEDDVAYADVYDKENKVFNFNKETFIMENKSVDTRPGMHWGFYYGLITNYGDQFNHAGWSAQSAGGPSYTIDMHGNDLNVDLEAFPKAGHTGGQPMWTSSAIFATREGTITINNPGKINLTTNANYYYGSVIRASSADSTPTGAHVVINNDQGNLYDHVVKLRGGIATPGYEMNFRTIETYGNTDSEYKNDNSVTIKGLVDIKSRYGAALYARGGNISIGGGRIEAEQYDAVWTTSPGQVNLNVITDENGAVTSVGSNDLIVIGNIGAVTDFYGAGGTINVGFVTPESYFTGQMYGAGNAVLEMWLQNGATWNNIPQLFKPWSGSPMIRDRSSMLTHLYGGATKEKAGNIYQTSTKDMQIDNLSGYVNFFVAHNEEDPANFEKVGGITIKNAAKNETGEAANITLITDALSKADLENEDTVKKVLNALSGKLVYSGYVDGERNLEAKAEIAEGLTAYSAAWIKRGDVAFQDEDGRGYLKEDSVATNPHPTEGPRPAVVHVGKDDAARNMRQYYANDNQLYIFEHNEENPSEVYGSDITIGNAEKDSHIRLRTDNDGIDIHDVDQVRDALNGLAGKLYYKGYVDGERNLHGQAEIAEGLTAKSAMMKFGDIQYRAEDGHGYFEDIKGIHTADPEIIYGPKETAMMRGAKSAMTGAMLTWREENNDLNKRLGEIRYGGAEAGAWGRIYGGKAKYDKDNASYNTDFKAVQVGYDRMVNDEWRAGVAFSYIDGDNSYKLGGDGTTNLASLALYGTKVADDGSYFDIVAKGSRVDTDYTVYNHEGKKLSGDYKTNGFTLSAEYGKRIDQGNGLYFIPQAELIYGHLASEDYDAVSTYAQGKKMHVEQGSFTSVVGRIGVSVGKETETTNLYAKASLLHEFDGKVTTTYKAAGEPVGQTEQDFGDTWFVLGIGGTHKLNADQYLYGNLERSFGGDVETEWRADLGIRWLF